MEPFLEIICFIFMGGLGGFVFILMKSDKWDDLKTFYSFKRYAIGGVSGFLYWFLYTEVGFPDFVMAFVVGHSGTTFIQNLVEAYRKKSVTT